MNRLVIPALLVLLIQCGIIAIVYWPQQASTNKSAVQPLAPFVAGTIDEIHIGDEYDNEAVLKKNGDRWLLPELENLPADPHKVDLFLERITGQDSSWPIAQSATARQRFQVADYHYQRRLMLLAGGEPLGTIYLGTSPGFRKIHARNKEQDGIYSIGFNVFDAPGVSGHWLEPRLLQVRTPTSITADSYSLNRESGEWLSGTGQAPDERELQALLAALRTLQVDGVADKDMQRELSEAEAGLILQVQSLAGDATLELFTIDSAHFIHSSEYTLFFKLSAYDYDRLTGIDFGLISGEITSEGSGEITSEGSVPVNP